MRKIYKYWKILLLAVVLLSTTFMVRLSAAGSISVIIFGDNIDESVIWEVGSNPVTWSANAFQDGAELDLTGDNKITWTSSDQTVILARNPSTSGVTSNIILQPVGAGTATITATYSYSDGAGHTATVTAQKTITVNLRVTNAPSNVFEDSDPNYTVNTNSNHDLLWYSNNPSVVSVSAGAAGKGILDFKGGGIATITCQEPDGSISASFDIVVNARFTETSTNVKIPYNANYTIKTNSGGHIYYESSDPNIVTVTSEGVARGRSAGMAQIYIYSVSSDNEWYSKITRRTLDVNVGLEIVSSYSNVVVGDILNLTTNIGGSYTSGINWISEDTSIAEVNSSGVVTTKKKGTVKIRASVYNETLFGTTDIQTAEITITIADKFSLSETEHSANAGDEFTLTAHATDSTANITWHSSNEGVVSVEADAEDSFTAHVTALSKGQATITATQNVNGVERKATCVVTVRLPVEGVSIESRLDLNKGQSRQLTLRFTPEIPDNRNVKWYSSDENIATVTQTGIVEAVGGGQTVITVISEDGMHVASCIVTVTVPVEQVELSIHNVQTQFSVGQYQLSCTVTPDEDGVNKEVKWTSDDESVAIVNENGLVTFIKPGMVTIRVTTRGLNAENMNESDNCLFSIKQPVTGVTLNTETLSKEVGDTFTLYATISPEDASNKNIVWKIPADAQNVIKKVDNNNNTEANFEAIGSGKCTLVAESADDGSIEAQCIVTVTQPVTSIEAHNVPITMRKGAKLDLNKYITILPSDASNKAVTWKSSNTTNVAVDSATGEASAVNAGNSTITVTSVGSSKVLTQFMITVVNDVTGVSLNYENRTINKDDTFMLRATVKPSNAYNKRVTYYSSDASVASVSSDGVVTGKKGGTAYIYAKTVEGGFISRCKVTVKEKVSSVKLSGNSHYLNYKKSKYLTATVTRTSASNKVLRWTSSNTKVLKVNSKTGRITAVGYGTAYVYARATDGSGKYARFRIRVIRPVKKVKISPSRVTLLEGKSKQLKATVTPSNASVKGITWKSSDKSVATVDSSGRITAVSPGSCTISATSKDGNKVKGNCYVVVRQVVETSAIRINASNMTMLRGQSRTLSARVSPSNSTESYKWYSSDTSVATVSKSGKVVAKGQGTAQIYAVSTVSGVESAACEVTVLALNSTRITLEQYDTFDLDVFGSSGTIRWYTSNKRVATVSSGGMITAKMAGLATITAKANGKTLYCRIRVVTMKK